MSAHAATPVFFESAESLRASAAEPLMRLRSSADTR